MKFLKYYEKHISGKPGEPELGDYVLCEEEGHDDTRKGKKIFDFVKNNVGKIKKISPECYGYQNFKYLVEFENVPEKLYKECFDHNGHKNCRRMDFEEIVDWNKDREKLEMKLATKKYNL